MTPHEIYAEHFETLAELHELATRRDWPEMVQAIERLAFDTWQSSLAILGVAGEVNLECDDALVRLKLLVYVPVRYIPDEAERARAVARGIKGCFSVYRSEVETVEHWNELLQEHARSAAS